MGQKKVNELKVGSIITYINLIISTIIPLLYTPIMLRNSWAGRVWIVQFIKFSDQLFDIIKFGIWYGNYTIHIKISNRRRS